METGTLEQIGAKDGDKVFCISNVIDYEDGERYNTFTSGNTYTFASRDMIGDDGDEWPGCHPLCGVWRIISRAAQATPTLDLTAVKTRNILAKQIIGKVEVTNTGKVWMQHTESASEMRDAAAALIRMADTLEPRHD